jgi:putative glutamine amidotransferase
MSTRKPVVGVPACRRMYEPHYYHVVGEKYLQAVAEAANCIPLIIPALGADMKLDVLIDLLDGLLLTGSISNVEPRHYDGSPSDPGTLHDPHRDEMTLPLIPDLIAAGMPLFAICRGFQEMNVAYGGSLHQKIKETGHYGDHAENPDNPLETQYGSSHGVDLTSGGLLTGITGKRHLQVNSLHHQGVDRLGDGLRVEATADDSLVEAFRVGGAPGFNLAVQWHPEWKPLENPDSTAIFDAFGDAVRDYSSANNR